MKEKICNVAFRDVVIMWHVSTAWGWLVHVSGTLKYHVTPTTDFSWCITSSTQNALWHAAKFRLACILSWCKLAVEAKYNAPVPVLFNLLTFSVLPVRIVCKYVYKHNIQWCWEQDVTENYDRKNVPTLTFDVPCNLVNYMPQHFIRHIFKELFSICTCPHHLSLNQPSLFTCLCILN